LRSLLPRQIKGGVQGGRCSVAVVNKCERGNLCYEKMVTGKGAHKGAHSFVLKEGREKRKARGVKKERLLHKEIHIWTIHVEVMLRFLASRRILTVSTKWSTQHGEEDFSSRA